MATGVSAKLAVVTWEDAYTPDRSAYTMTGTEAIGDYRPHVVETVGFIAHQDAKVVIVARDLYAERFRDFMYIPRGMVRKIRALR